MPNNHGFHPIRDYLGSLEWDCTKRIDTWLPDYLGAEATPYTRAVGSRWLIGSVARVYKPGCKCDCCLILEGKQGTLKSTALLALGTPWFTDEISDLGSKDAALQLLGAWIIELPELDVMQRVEVSRIKAFMSRSIDRYRPPYGRRVVAVPRQCIFAGTVNHETYFQDETGARRFWPVKTGCMKIAELKRDRDQLWAEARERYEAGRSWWLENSWLVKLAADEQRARYESDPWDDRIAAFIDSRESVSVTEVLELCIKKPKQQWVQADQNRVARSLCSLGLARFRDRVGTKRPWRYRRVGG